VRENRPARAAPAASPGRRKNVPDRVASASSDGGILRCARHPRRVPECAGRSAGTRHQGTGGPERLSAAERRIRLGYVGAGRQAQQVHLPNFASIEGCDLAGLAEVRPSLGREVADRFRIPELYPDHRALAADRRIDAIAVSAPFELQGEIARDCLERGKHVFMEKPMAISLAQADRILDASRRGGGRLMIAYMKRYDAGNILVRDVVRQWRRSGEAGALRYVRAHGFRGDFQVGVDAIVSRSAEAPPLAPNTNFPEWLTRDRTAYVDYLQQYTHNINLVRYFLDAAGDAQIEHVDLDDDGSGIVILRVAGVRCVLETGRLAYHRWDEHVQVYFDGGWILTWAPPLLVRNTTAEVEIYRGGAGVLDSTRFPGVQHSVSRPIPEPRGSWAYRREAEHFIERLLSGEPFDSEGADTRTDVRLFEEIYRRRLGV